MNTDEAFDKIEKICKDKKLVVVKIPNGMQAYKTNPLAGHGSGQEVLWARKEWQITKDNKKIERIAIVSCYKKLLIEIGCSQIEHIPYTEHYSGYFNYSSDKQQPDKQADLDKYENER